MFSFCWGNFILFYMNSRFETRSRHLWLNMNLILEYDRRRHTHINSLNIGFSITLINVNENWSWKFLLRLLIAYLIIIHFEQHAVTSSLWFFFGVFSLWDSICFCCYQMSKMSSFLLLRIFSLDQTKIRIRIYTNKNIQQKFLWFW